MKLTISLVSLMLLLAAAGASAQTSRPEQAQAILSAAMKQAETSNRTIFLIFQASWCDWCDRFNAALETPEVREVIDESYVIARIDVMEFGENRSALENPGGREIMSALGGATSPLPFYAFLDSSGRKLADSNVVSNRSFSKPEVEGGSR